MNLNKPNQSLGKVQRLAGKKMVAEIFDVKNVIHAGGFKTFYAIQENSSSPFRIGVSVPKKRFKRAVDRNKIKRLVKESIRRNKTFLEETLYKKHLSVNFMIVCLCDNIPSQAYTDGKIKQLLERLAKRINENESN